MIAAIPPPLKAADIARFALRAGQLEKAKPVVAYYCYYWISDQIISKALHQVDDDCMTYTTDLMDKLEQMKADSQDNDAITDDLAGQAYVEQFAQETFQRAENAMKVNKVTRQTADTFQAAATFMDLGQIWGPLDAETSSQIKFAKYHALRIAKAIKAGEDPNDSNPTPAHVPIEPKALDPSDPEVLRINGANEQRDQVPKPSVEDVPDENDPAQHSMSHSESIHDSRPVPQAFPMPSHLAPEKAPSPPASAEDYYASSTQPDVSPLQSLSADQTLSHEEEYFPAVPDAIRDAQGTPSSAQPVEPLSPESPPYSSAVLPSPDPSGLPQSLASSAGLGLPNPDAQPREGRRLSGSNDRVIHPSKNRDQDKAPEQVRPQPHMRSQPPAMPAAYVETVPQVDEEDIFKAQKHARWAISALNFEDVKTAVAELKGALKSLGAD